jgi:hypothetical protein
MKKPQKIFKETIGGALELRIIQRLFRSIIPSRQRLVLLLEILNLQGEGAEIGVETGNFSECILKHSALSVLHSIDAWQEFDRSVYDDSNNVSQGEQEEKYKLTLNRLRRFKRRSNIIRMTSREASQLFKTATLDFIHIDANHSYRECKSDLDIWWPKLRNGGIFSGHDYANGKLHSGTYAVKQAVDEFVKKHRQILFIITEATALPTWYLIKNMDINTLNLLLKRVLLCSKFNKSLVSSVL